jgi:hypothetical protein
MNSRDDIRKSQLKTAQEKYVKVSTRSYVIRMNKEKDAEAIEMLDRCGNRQDYIRKLIKQDIKANGGDIRTISNERKSIVEISFDEKSDTWKAICKTAGLSVKSDSYDILIRKIKDTI